MAFELFVDLPQFRRKPDIVRIQQRDHFASSMLETEIEGRSLPAVLLSQIADLFPKLPQTLFRIIGRAVVHDQNFPLLSRKILRQHARNSVFDEFTVVVGIDQDGEERSFHSCLLGLFSRCPRQLCSLCRNNLFENDFQSACDFPILIMAQELSRV